MYTLFYIKKIIKKIKKIKKINENPKLYNSNNFLNKKISYL